MSVFLIGGGWSDERVGDMFGGFVAAAATRTEGRDPRVLMVLLGTDDGGAGVPRALRPRPRAGRRPRARRRADRRRATPSTPHGSTRSTPCSSGAVTRRSTTAPCPRRTTVIRERVTAGLPYAGFSAGAAIAATTAIIGGWRIDGVPVCPEDSDEGLDPVTVVDGIGLVGGAVDVHAAQWGNLSRLVAAVEAGLVPARRGDRRVHHPGSGRHRRRAPAVPGGSAPPPTGSWSAAALPARRPTPASAALASSSAHRAVVEPQLEQEAGRPRRPRGRGRSRGSP